MERGGNGFHSERACHSARERISLELDGELAAREAVRLRVHLVACPTCSADRRRLTAIVSALRSGAPELPRSSAAWPRVSRARVRSNLAMLATTAAVVLTGAIAVSQHLNRPGSVGALSAAQGMPIYGGLAPDQGYPVYVYGQAPLPRLT
jgi:anti-sigma factor RsiW